MFPILLIKQAQVQHAIGCKWLMVSLARDAHVHLYSQNAWPDSYIMRPCISPVKAASLPSG